jgi:hypothetical protein
MASIDAESQKLLNEGVFELRRGLTQVEDEMFGGQTKLGAQILANAVTTVLTELNPRAVKDLDFAFNDLLGLTADLPPFERAALDPAFNLLQQGIARLKSSVAIAPTVVDQLKILRAKLSDRRSAFERQLYKPPGSPVEPLPNAPSEMREAASLLQQQLVVAGFETPTLDRMIAEPGTFELRDVSELIDEIDVIMQ